MYLVSDFYQVCESCGCAHTLVGNAELPDFWKGPHSCPLASQRSVVTWRTGFKMGGGGCRWDTVSSSPEAARVMNAILQHCRKLPNVQRQLLTNSVGSVY